ncbi:MAG TPA: serine/threonine-protein kinase [Rudaea sp.]|jgi:serine/threonine-protein kinase
MSTSPTDWSRVKALFAEALDRPEHERATWLEAVCENTAVLAEVRSLLAAQAAPVTHILGEGIQHLIPPLLLDDEPLIDTRVGPYRLLRLLGEGGMGRVFLAERADGEFRQQVALKLMRPGFVSGEVNERFRRERELLARLAHPNIAQLHDGGLSADRSPYFTLEYVEGEPVVAWCDTRKLPIKGRLALLLKICDAVQYAHRNLIVHRDLKPSNILVTADGEPKLLDFGIAKALDTQNDRGLTGTQSQPMTREYAAPEQVLGEPITTATDVYALGVLLYELLSGHVPYARAARGDVSWAKAIVEEQPEPLTRAIARAQARALEDAGDDAASARGASFAGLRHTLRGDLDRIVQRALEKEPEARYASVTAFADDVRAYIEGRALPGGSRRYRVMKFLRRHRVGVAMTALTVILAGAGIGGIVYQASETAREAQAVSAVKEFLLSLFAASSPNEARGHDLSVRELLDRGRTQIERNLSAQPEVRSELQGALGRIYFQLGIYDKAEALQRNALASAGSNGHDRAVLSRQMAETLAARGNLAEAEPLATRAGAALEDGGDPQERVRAWITRSTIAQKRGNATQAEQFAMRAIRLARHPEIPPELLGNALSAQGLAEWDLRNVPQSEALYREALQIHRAAFGDVDLRVASDRQNLTLALRNLGRYEEALEQCRANIDIVQKILGPTHPDVSRALFTLGTTLYHMARYEEAESVLRRAVAVARASLGDHPTTATALNNLGLVLMDWHGLDEAEQVFRESVRIATAQLGANHSMVLIAASNLGYVHGRQGKLELAENELRDVLARDRASGIRDQVWELNRLGDVRRQRGDWQEAVSLHRLALQQSIALFAPNTRQTALSHYYLGLALIDADEPQEAASQLRAAIASYRGMLPPDGAHPVSASARLALGSLLAREPKSHDEGTVLLREAVALRERFLGIDDPRTIEARDALASVTKK